MQPASVLGVEGEEPGVAVALARQRRDPHQPDHELGPAQAGRALGEPLDLGLEPAARDRVVEVGVDLLHPGGEAPDLALLR